MILTAIAAIKRSGTETSAPVDESRAGRLKSTPTMMKKIGIKKPNPIASS